MMSYGRTGSLGTTRMFVAVAVVFAGAIWHVVQVATDAGPVRRPKVVLMREAGSPRVAARETGKIVDPDLSVPKGADPFRPLDASTMASRPPVAAPALSGDIALPAEIAPSRPPSPPFRASAPSLPLLVRLTGVVVGSRPTAVLQIEGEEIIVRPGSLLTDGSSVDAIDRGSLTLCRQGKKIQLRIVE